MAEQCPTKRSRMECLVVEESSVESNSGKQVSSINLTCIEMYLIPLKSWEGTEHCPGDRMEIGYLAVEESGIKFNRARKYLSSYY